MRRIILALGFAGILSAPALARDNGLAGQWDMAGEVSDGKPLNSVCEFQRAGPDLTASCSLYAAGFSRPVVATVNGNVLNWNWRWENVGELAMTATVQSDGTLKGSFKTLWTGFSTPELTGSFTLTRAPAQAG